MTRTMPKPDDAAKSLEVLVATERETKKPRHQVAHGEHALAHYTRSRNSKKNGRKTAEKNNDGKSAEGGGGGVMALGFA